MCGRVILLLVLLATLSAAQTGAAQVNAGVNGAIESIADAVGPRDTVVAYKLGRDAGQIHLAATVNMCRAFDLRLVMAVYTGRLCRLPRSLRWRIMNIDFVSPPVKSSTKVIQPAKPAESATAAHHVTASPDAQAGAAERAHRAQMAAQSDAVAAERSQQAQAAAARQAELAAQQRAVNEARQQQAQADAARQAQAMAQQPSSLRDQAAAVAATAARQAVAAAAKATAALAETNAASSRPVTRASVDLVRQLQSMPIVYNRPTRLSFDQDTPISLVVEGLGAGSAKDALNGLSGAQVASAAMLSPSVSARLTGPSDEVSIEAESAETQRVSTIANTSWLWQVRAKQPGQTTLTLELDANVMIAGKSTPLQVRTYTDRFPVSISPISRSAYEVQRIDPIWKFLGLGTPAAIIAGLWAWLKRRRVRIAREMPRHERAAAP